MSLPNTAIRLRTMIACLLGGAIVVGCSGEKEPGDEGSTRPTEAAVSADVAFRAMIENEETIGELVSPINRVARAVRNLQLPGHHAGHLFADGATAIDLAAPGKAETDPSLRLQKSDWQLAAEAPLAGEIWSRLWEEASAFGDARFGILRGRPEGGGYLTELKFSARGQTVDRKPAAWKGRVDVVWQKDGDEWRIRRWLTRSLQTKLAEEPMFVEVLDRAIGDPGELARARESIHSRYVREVFLTGGTKFAYPKTYWPYITSWDSLDQHPSVSVVDIDADGLDDFYITARWGKNQLWRNRGDGTFEDIAPQVGLDLDGMCNCALFADYDNDGDQDVFIGRSLERGQYFTNTAGQFFESSATNLDAPLPYWCSSMASADVDGDGLLDLYISTYRLPITRPQNILAREFLSPAEQQEWKRRRAEDHPVFRLTGPPNVLLMNQGGGKFARVPDAGGAALWLSTFQATWSDYDNDGDPDLFVANDYAPDHIFRNDGGTLVDATHQLAGEELQGFGMGVSLGDYDNDGLQDPYFTYMYSKAGSRITEMFDGLERRMYEGVAGNKLLRNQSGKFVPSGMEVAKTGWSWGGQFTDLDNDGFLDLYVANGLYTPPAAAATEVDL